MLTTRRWKQLAALAAAGTSAYLAYKRHAAHSHPLPAPVAALYPVRIRRWAAYREEEEDAAAAAGYYKSRATAEGDGERSGAPSRPVPGTLTALTAATGCWLLGTQWPRAGPVCDPHGPRAQVGGLGDAEPWLERTELLIGAEGLRYLAAANVLGAPRTRLAAGLAREATPPIPPGDGPARKVTSLTRTFKCADSCRPGWRGELRSRIPGPRRSGENHHHGRFRPPPLAHCLGRPNPAADARPQLP
jgi:hypothetical protein